MTRRARLIGILAALTVFWAGLSAAAPGTEARSGLWTDITDTGSLGGAPAQAPMPATDIDDDEGASHVRLRHGAAARVEPSAARPERAGFRPSYLIPLQTGPPAA